MLAVSNIMQYVQLEKFRSQPISEIDIGQVFEGSYAGRANYGFEYEVKVDIKNHDSFFYTFGRRD